MPALFGSTNRFESPTTVLISQALLGAALSVLFLFVPTVNAAYWILSALTVQVLCLMYMLVFASVVALRYSQPETARAYLIPGGMAGVWIVGGAGFVACLFTLVVGFFPPSNVESGSTLVYVVGMIVGTILLSCPPFLFLATKGRLWARASPSADCPRNRTSSHPAARRVNGHAPRRARSLVRGPRNGAARRAPVSRAWASSSMVACSTSAETNRPGRNPASHPTTQVQPPLERSTRRARV